MTEFPVGRGDTEPELAAVKDYELLRRALGASPEAILFLRTDGVVADCNASAEALFGWPCAEIRGRHISTLLSPEERATAAELIRGRDSGDHVRRVVAAVRADGSRVLAEITSSPAGDGGGFIEFVRDITEPV